jgi:hypothetical protein
MKTENTYDCYPGWIVVLSNLVSLLTYGLGFLIIFKVGPIFSILYLAYVAILELRLMRYHCVDCFYWGKTCGFGKGRLSSIFFKKGDAAKFFGRPMSWKNMIPDLLVPLAPVVVGIVLLIIKFNILTLLAILLLILLTTVGNGFIRGTLTCGHCKQRELGCPAEKLFNKNKSI